MGLIRALELWYRSLTHRPDDVFDAWAAALDTVGLDVTVVESGTTWNGTALGVQRDGGLLVETSDGQRSLRVCSRCFRTPSRSLYWSITSGYNVAFRLRNVNETFDPAALRSVKRHTATTSRRNPVNNHHRPTQISAEFKVELEKDLDTCETTSDLRSRNA